MKILNKGKWRILGSEEEGQAKLLHLFETILHSKYQLKRELKSNQRSWVAHIKINGQPDMVLKIPIEKNNRLWIRFLTWFRLGEAFKNFRGMKILKENNIPTTTPILAAEKRWMGMVTKSWLLYEYLDGKPCLKREGTFSAVVKTLTMLHNKDLLHGDPQIRNFMTYKNEIYVIDSNPQKATFTFNKAFEYAYLKRSCPEIEPYFGPVKYSAWYKLAIWYDQFDRKLAATRRKIKTALGFRKNV